MGLIKEPKLFADFLHFSRLHMESGDVDPLYPVLGRVLQGGDEDTKGWGALLYVAFYNLPSMLTWWHRTVEQEPEDWRPEEAHLPTGVERRSLRGGTNMVRHLRDLAGHVRGYESVRGWLTSHFTGEPETDWHQLQATVKEVWGNGRWAGYKTAEVGQKVLGLPVEPSDMGNAGSTGPRKGLELLCGPAASPAELDSWGAYVHDVMLDDKGIQLDLAQVETCLCDFHSMTKGHYYVGYDIDALQEQIAKAGLEPEREVELWEARAATLRPEYLGELNGWGGVDKVRAAEYRDRGVILARH